MAAAPAEEARLADDDPAVWTTAVERAHVAVLVRRGDLAKLDAMGALPLAVSDPPWPPAAYDHLTGSGVAALVDGRRRAAARGWLAAAGRPVRGPGVARLLWERFGIAD